MKRRLGFIFGAGLVVFLASTGVCWQKNQAIRAARPAATAHQRFIAVEPGVELEVLDFGGAGRALVLLAGLGGTAHLFAEFASKLTPDYHVIAITRRGFGLSSMPRSGYHVKRLGADVIAVIGALNLDRPILVGHSIAGGELSAVATFHPEKIAGAVYLDAGYTYALWDEVYGNKGMWLAGIAQYIEPLIPAAIEGPTLAVMIGQRRFTRLPVPTLAIFAEPHDLSAAFKDPIRREREQKLDLERTGRQSAAFQRQVPSARVIRLPRAAHDVFRSNEAEVLAQMKAFIATLQ